MLHNLSFQEVQNNVVNEQDPETLRRALLLSNALVSKLDETVASLVDELKDLNEENELLIADVDALAADADRYALLKSVLPACLEIAATAGVKHAATFGGLDPARLDQSLDTLIELGALDQLREAYEAEELAQAAGSRQD
jgi:uncharacterized protein YutE (UPF0331/DUF86 family)